MGGAGGAALRGAGGIRPSWIICLAVKAVCLHMYTCLLVRNLHIIYVYT